MSGPLYGLQASQTSSPSTPVGLSCASTGGNCCADTPGTSTGPPGLVYFNPTVPFGLESNGNPIGDATQTNSNQGYNCAPINNRYFVGWSNIFNAINALLLNAQPSVYVDELEFGQQEMNLFQFPAYYRLIYDNFAGHAVAPQTTTPVLTKLADMMASYNFDPLRVIWSIPWTDSSQYVSTNCTNVYEDYARNTNLDEIVSGILGGSIGNWDPNTFVDGLPCSQTVADPLYAVPYTYSVPDAIDAHIYPSLTSGTPGTQTQATIQAIAQTDYGDLVHIFSDVPSLQGATVIIGETYPGTIYPGWDPYAQPPALCWNAPTSAPAGNVQGFNQSALANYSVVFRPWMNLEDSTDACFGYGLGPASTANYPTTQSNFQNVNLGQQGPYVPTNQTNH